MLLLALAPAAWAVVPEPGDAFVSDSGGMVLWHVDGTTGDRTVVSSPGAGHPLGGGQFLCSDLDNPYDCCTGSGTGDGTGACAVVGSGPQWRIARGIAVTPAGDVLVTAHPSFSGFAPCEVQIVYRVDPLSGNRSIASTDDLSFLCSAAGQPLACCTGPGTGDGTPPCAAVGSGDFSNCSYATELAHIATVPSPPPQPVASLPAWGLPLLAGILLGLSIKAMRRQATAPASGGGTVD
jgi:hypothetical protein